MERLLTSICVLLISVGVFAQQNDFADLQAGRNDSNRKVYLTETEKALVDHVQRELEEKCDRHGCTYVSRREEKKGWNFSFSVGQGGYNGQSGTNYYIGAGVQQTTDVSYGITISYTNMTCTSDFKIQQDEFQNLMRRAIGERDPNSPIGMNRLSTDNQFMHLVKLEIYKQLAQAGCLR